ncbi:WD40-repeat-containing domain protein [Pilobolus umbonatus]|nr:WD40-repeat-containing domain protein [Pilobolus umbonatus]
MTESSSVFGLRHQARCLTPVVSSTEKSQFLAGTVGVKENGVVLIEYDDETAVIKSTVYSHPDEVWDIVSCPTNKDLLFTCHSPVSGNPIHRQATLWKIPEVVEDKPQLIPLLSLDKNGTKKIIWSPSESQVISMHATTLSLTTVNESSAETLLDIDVQSTMTTDSFSLHQLQNAVYTPHQPEIVTVGDRSLSGWDLRSGECSFLRKDAHESTIRAVDYNQNKPFHVVTGGDDANVLLWDVRHLDEPLMKITGHTHWVWSVAFNHLQDQLLLTSSSDTLVNLHNVISVSAAAYLNDSSEDESETQSIGSRREVPTDGLVCTYDQHEDSVYKVAWSPADIWTFASISYGGRVVISQVPTHEKFKILGL